MLITLKSVRTRTSDTLFFYGLITLPIHIFKPFWASRNFVYFPVFPAITLRIFISKLCYCESPFNFHESNFADFRTLQLPTSKYIRASEKNCEIWRSIFEILLSKSSNFDFCGIQCENWEQNCAIFSWPSGLNIFEHAPANGVFRRKNRNFRP